MKNEIRKFDKLTHIHFLYVSINEFIFGANIDLFHFITTFLELLPRPSDSVMCVF